MCGRYTITPTLSQLLAGLDLDAVNVPESSEPIVERFNVAPTQPVLAIASGEDGPRAKVLRWGLIPYWSKDPKKEPLRINARMESLTERPSFRGLVEDARSRCLVPADGWYEWLKAEDPKQPRKPMHFSLPDRRPFAFAGLRSTWKSPDGRADRELHDHHRPGQPGRRRDPRPHARRAPGRRRSARRGWTRRSTPPP